MKRFLIIASGVISAIYLLNPSAGLLELIPDNIPLVGNLDEGAAAYILISVIAYLRGKDFGLFSEGTAEIDNRSSEADKKETKA